MACTGYNRYCSSLSDIQQEVMVHLKQIFPNMTQEVFTAVLLHPTTNVPPFSVPILTQRCIELLLQHQEEEDHLLGTADADDDDDDIEDDVILDYDDDIYVDDEDEDGVTVTKVETNDVLITGTGKLPTEVVLLPEEEDHWSDTGLTLDTGAIHLSGEDSIFIDSQSSSDSKDSVIRAGEVLSFSLPKSDGVAPCEVTRVYDQDTVRATFSGYLAPGAAKPEVQTVPQTNVGPRLTNVHVEPFSALNWRDAQSSAANNSVTIPPKLPQQTSSNYASGGGFSQGPPPKIRSSPIKPSKLSSVVGTNVSTNSLTGKVPMSSSTLSCMSSSSSGSSSQTIPTLVGNPHGKLLASGASAIVSGTPVHATISATPSVPGGQRRGASAASSTTSANTSSSGSALPGSSTKMYDRVILMNQPSTSGHPGVPADSGPVKDVSGLRMPSAAQGLYSSVLDFSDSDPEFPDSDSDDFLPSIVYSPKVKDRLFSSAEGAAGVALKPCSGVSKNVNVLLNRKSGSDAIKSNTLNVPSVSSALGPRGIQIGTDAATGFMIPSPTKTMAKIPTPMIATNTGVIYRQQQQIPHTLTEPQLGKRQNILTPAKLIQHPAPILHPVSPPRSFVNAVGAAGGNPAANNSSTARRAPTTCQGYTPANNPAAVNIAAKNTNNKPLLTYQAYKPTNNHPVNQAANNNTAARTVPPINPKNPAANYPAATSSQAANNNAIPNNPLANPQFAVRQGEVPEKPSVTIRSKHKITYNPATLNQEGRHEAYQLLDGPFGRPGVLDPWQLDARFGGMGRVPVARNDGSVQDVVFIQGEVPAATKNPFIPGSAAPPAVPPIPVIDVKPTSDQPKLPIKNEIMQIFPDICPDHLGVLCEQYARAGDGAVAMICGAILDAPSYPKKRPASPVKQVTPATQVSSNTPKETYKEFDSTPIDSSYNAHAFHLLMQDFPWFSANDIKSVTKLFNHRYAASYRALKLIWRQGEKVYAESKLTQLKAMKFRADFQHDSKKHTIKICLLKNRRPVMRPKSEAPERLVKEIKLLKEQLGKQKEAEDHQMAVEVNEKEYEEAGDSIECGCCYVECSFEGMVQCSDGHLFCDNCLIQYTRESIFGQGKTDLKCMTDLCDASFPKSQLQKALPAEMMVQYEERVTEESLNLADLGDIVKCPHCDFRALMDPGDKVFRCQLESCKKETCRYCQVDWFEHFGKPCEEVEKKDETKLRLEYEEKMTQAKVRVCHKCKAHFTKEDGCNKIICRCSATMCYICRKPNINYDHFCRHVRNPGFPCSECKQCSLWSSSEEDDNRAIVEIQKEADEKRKTQGYTEEKVIGVPEGPPVKRAKR